MKHFCTRCLKHFTEQRTFQQHKRYCKNEVKPGNLIDDLRIIGGYSKEVRKARYDRVRQLLQKLDTQVNVHPDILFIPPSYLFLKYLL